MARGGETGRPPRRRVHRFNSRSNRAPRERVDRFRTIPDAFQLGPGARGAGVSQGAVRCGGRVRRGSRAHA